MAKVADVNIAVAARPHEELSEQVSPRMMVGSVLGPLAGLALWFAPIQLEPVAHQTLAIVAFMIVYWITEPIDHGITAMIGCFLFWALHIAEFETAFAGWANSSPWFLFGAMRMAEAASQSCLARRIGFLIMRYLGTSYSRLLLSVVVIVFVLYFLVPPALAQLAIVAPMVIRLTAAFAVGLWATELWHKTDPAVIALGVGLMVALPNIGLLKTRDIQRVNFLLIIFMAGALSMGEVLAKTKALDALTDVMMSWMTPYLGGSFHSASVLYWTAFAYHFVLASELSMLSTSLPILVNFAVQHGFNPVALAMVWNFASGGKMFVYQSAVLILGYSYGYFQGKDLIRVGLVLTIVEGLILLFLVPFYWPLIGLQWVK